MAIGRYTEHPTHLGVYVKLLWLSQPPLYSRGVITPDVNALVHGQTPHRQPFSTKWRVTDIYLSYFRAMRFTNRQLVLQWKRSSWFRQDHKKRRRLLRQLICLDRQFLNQLKRSSPRFYIGIRFIKVIYEAVSSDPSFKGVIPSILQSESLVSPDIFIMPLTSRTLTNLSRSVTRSKPNCPRSRNPPHLTRWSHSSVCLRNGALSTKVVTLY